jgi:hypothetical protein
MQSDGSFEYPMPQMEGGGPSEGYALDIGHFLFPLSSAVILPLQLQSIAQGLYALIQFLLCFHSDG